MKPIQQDQKQERYDRRSDRTGEAVPGVVEEILGKAGFRGELTQVKVRIMRGIEQGKTIRRNVKGPIRIKDVLMLRETQIEARRIKTKIVKGAYT